MDHRGVWLVGLALAAACMGRSSAPQGDAPAPTGAGADSAVQEPSCPTGRTAVTGHETVPLVLRAAWFESAGIDPESPLFVLVDENPLRLMNPDEVARAASEAYPAGLRDAGVSTAVTVGLRVQPDGSTDDWTVVRTSGYEPVDGAALGVAERMEFAPPELDGCPVTVRAALPVRFGSG